MNENSFAAVRLRTKKFIEEGKLPKDFELASILFQFSPPIIEYMNKNFPDWYYEKKYGRLGKTIELSFVYNEYVFIINKYIEYIDMESYSVYKIDIENLLLFSK